MEKKTYHAPAIVVSIVQTEHILAVSRAVGNAGIIIGGSGSTSSRSFPHRDIWSSGWE